MIRLTSVFVIFTAFYIILYDYSAVELMSRSAQCNINNAFLLGYVPFIARDDRESNFIFVAQ